MKPNHPRTLPLNHPLDSLLLQRRLLLRVRLAPAGALLRVPHLVLARRRAPLQPACFGV